MKKYIAVFLIHSLLLSSYAHATSNSQPCQTSVSGEQSVVRICNDVSDIICKNIKPNERRSCQDSNEFVFSKETTKEDLFQFANGCFKSGVTSFAQFFTDFIPELLKGIWNVTVEASSAAKATITGEGPGLWSKLKGMYESSTSISADIYEAVQENPGAYFQKIWSKIVDVIGPMVANHDCLNPQKKVEHICGFVSEFLIPPVILAKVLVRGIKEIKFLKEYGVLSNSEKGNLIKALSNSENRPILTMKEIIATEKKFKALGYSSEEFEILYKTGAFNKFKLEELKPLSSAEGKRQRELLLGELKKAEEKTVVLNSSKSKIKPKVANYNLSDDFITVSAVDNKSRISGQIVSRVVKEGKEVAYLVRMIDPKNGNIHEMMFDAEKLIKLNPQKATPEMAAKVSAAVSKDTRFKSPEEELRAIQKEREMWDAAHVNPNSMGSLVVGEASMAEFRAAEVALSESSQMQGIQKAKEVKQLSDEAKRLKEAEAIKIKAKKEGIEVEELTPDDPRNALFNNSNTQNYEGGIDFVSSENARPIVKSEHKTPKPKEPILDNRAVEKYGSFRTEYVQVMSKNSMGLTSIMPAQIVKRVIENGRDIYIIRIIDKSSGTATEVRKTLPELKMEFKIKENTAMERDVKEYIKSNSGREEGLP